MLETLLPLLLPLLLGKLILKFGLCTALDIQGLKTFVLKVAVPLLIFENLLSANMEAIEELQPIAAGYFLTSILFFILALLVNHLLKWNKLDRRSAVLSIFQGNHAYLAMALIGNLYGNQGLTLVILYVVCFWPVFLLAGYTYVALETGESLHPWSLCKKTIRFGGLPISVSFLAILMRVLEVQVPEILADFLHPFGQMVVPLILVCVGADINFSQSLKNIGKIVPMALFRPIIGGFVGAAVILTIPKLIEVRELTARVLFLQATMPTAYMTVFFTQDLDSNKSLLASSMTLGTIFAFFTVPFWDQIFTIVWPILAKFTF